MKNTVLFTFLLSLTLPALAQKGPPPDGGRNGGGPPPEVLNACKGKKEGDRAQLKTPHGDTVAGVCRLVLVPEGGNNRPQAARK